MASESINDFAIKLGVDATGVATGMAAANAVILQSQREIAKAEAVEREINLQQKIEAEEKFNKWYATENEREFQAWYKLEQQKENVLQEEAATRERIARETAVAIQQANINTYNEAISNERRLTTTIEEETQKQIAFSRMLQEAVVARYAAQDAAEEAAVDRADTETQGVMDAAWNRIVAQQRQTLEAFYAEKDRLASESAAHTLRVTEQERKYQEQQEADRIKALREDIQARARAAVEQQRLTEEEAEHYTEQQNRRVAAAFRAQKRIEEDAARFRAGAGTDMPAAMSVTNVSPATLRMIREFVAEETRANNLREDAATLIRQLATAQDLHTERVAEYNRMLAIGALTQDQFNAAVARSTQIANASAGGFGGAGAAITQASYAAEDFIQVLSMGGGMNMALMSASNNLSMVARSVLGTNAAMGALAGFGVPALLIGLGMLIRYLSDTESRFDALTESFDEFNAAAKRLAELESIRIDAEIRLTDINRMTDVEDIESEIEDSDRELKRLNRDAALLLKEQERLAAHAREIFYGGEEGTFVNFMAKLQQDANEFNQAGFEDAAADIERRIEGMKAVKAQLDEALKEGSINDIKRLSAELTRLMEASSVGIRDQEATDLLGILGSMQEILDDEEALRALGEKLIDQGHERAKVEETVNAVLEERQKLIEQLAYAEEQAAGQAQRQRQQRMREELDFMRMSEAEREMKRLRDEQAAFAGIDTAFVGPQLPISEEAFTQEFMNQQLEQVQKEIDQLRKPGYAQGLEQNTYEAQAKAFEQMFKAQFGPRDAQVERLDTLIEIQRQLVEQGAQAPRFNVVPGG